MTTIIASLTLTVFPLMIGTWEVVAIVAVILLLFGGRKIPELMRGLGKGVKEFKSGMKEAGEAVEEIKEEIVGEKHEEKGNAEKKK